MPTQYRYRNGPWTEDEITLQDVPGGNEVQGDYADAEGSTGTIWGNIVWVSDDEEQVTVTFRWSEPGYRGVETLEYRHEGDAIGARGVFWEDGRDGQRVGEERSR